MCGIVGVVTESAIARDIDTRMRERRSTGRVEFGLRALGGDRHSPNMQRQLNLKSSSARVSVPFLRPPFCAKMWRSGSTSMAKAATGKICVMLGSDRRIGWHLIASALIYGDPEPQKG